MQLLLKKKLFASLFILVTHQGHSTKESTLPVHIHFLSPHTLTPEEHTQHKELASHVFFSYDTSIHYAGPLQSYYDYFENFLNSFKKQKNKEFLISAKDSNGHLVGGLFGKALEGPIPALNITKNQTAYFLDCVYVSSAFQNKGIATKMLNLLITETSTHPRKLPLFLYVWAINTAARKVYEKCGFSLVVDAQHPDGKGTAAAYALQTSPGYNPEDFVVYQKS